MFYSSSLHPTVFEFYLCQGIFISKRGLNVALAFLCCVKTLHTKRWPSCCNELIPTGTVVFIGWLFLFVRLFVRKMIHCDLCSQTVKLKSIDSRWINWRWHCFCWQQHNFGGSPFIKTTMTWGDEVICFLHSKCKLCVKSFKIYI